VDFAARAAALTAVENPDWDRLVQGWSDGHVKLAWTRHLLKLRTELADLFAYGDYQPLEVTGPHRDHVIAFARRHGSDAAITVVAKLFAPFSQDGRTWPRAEGFEGSLKLAGYSLQGIDGEGRSGEVPLSMLFRHLPAAVLKARVESALKPRRKRNPA
jgi:(1->4)-alpha-D-glucan 1-alpha-D-glucosylmutase